MPPKKNQNFNEIKANDEIAKFLFETGDENQN